jgi:hypothetical protein
MRKAAHATDAMLRTCLITLAAAIAVFSIIAATGSVSAADAAARSTNVTLVNQTGCDLNRTSEHLIHGAYSIVPPTLIRIGEQGIWRSRSKGIATGTEGRVTYRTSDCENRNLKQKDIRMHWDNPFIGANSYDDNGTDPAFRVDHEGGSGNDANVTFFARRN